MGYLVSWLAAFLIIGAFWYVADRLLGVKLYRWFYDMTHKDPLPPAESRGFIYQRKAQARFFTAIIIAIGQGAIILKNTHDSPLVELLTFIFQIPVLMLGFYFGPFIFRFWERKEEIFDRMDKIESGELGLKDEIKQAAEKAVHAVQETLSTATESAAKAVPDPADSISPAPEKETEKSAPEPSPQEMMQKYLRRD